MELSKLASLRVMVELAVHFCSDGHHGCLLSMQDLVRDLERELADLPAGLRGAPEVQESTGALRELKRAIEIVLARDGITAEPAALY